MSLLLMGEMSLLVDAGGAMSAGLLGGWLPLLLALGGSAIACYGGKGNLLHPASHYMCPRPLTTQLSSATLTANQKHNQLQQHCCLFRYSMNSYVA